MSRCRVASRAAAVGIVNRYDPGGMSRVQMLVLEKKGALELL